jgi:hypothetical protein
VARWRPPWRRGQGIRRASRGHGPASPRHQAERGSEGGRARRHAPWRLRGTGIPRGRGVWRRAWGPRPGGPRPSKRLRSRLTPNHPPSGAHPHKHNHHATTHSTPPHHLTTSIHQPSSPPIPLLTTYHHNSPLHLAPRLHHAPHQAPSPVARLLRPHGLICHSAPPHPIAAHDSVCDRVQVSEPHEVTDSLCVHAVE